MLPAHTGRVCRRTVPERGLPANPTTRQRASALLGPMTTTGRSRFLSWKCASCRKAASFCSASGCACRVQQLCLCLPSNLYDSLSYNSKEALLAHALGGRQLPSLCTLTAWLFDARYTVVHCQPTMRSMSASDRLNMRMLRRPTTIRRWMMSPPSLRPDSRVSAHHRPAAPRCQALLTRHWLS